MSVEEQKTDDPFPTVFSHVVNFYLASSKPGELDADYDAKTALYNQKLELQGKLVALATRPTADSPEQLAGYVREALRKSFCRDFVAFGTNVDRHLVNKLEQYRS
jgi:hypothetical protein